MENPKNPSRIPKTSNPPQNPKITSPLLGHRRILSNLLTKNQLLWDRSGVLIRSSQKIGVVCHSNNGSKEERRKRALQIPFLRRKRSRKRSQRPNNLNLLIRIHTNGIKVGNQKKNEELLSFLSRKLNRGQFDGIRERAVEKFELKRRSLTAIEGDLALKWAFLRFPLLQEKNKQKNYDGVVRAIGVWDAAVDHFCKHSVNWIRKVEDSVKLRREGRYGAGLGFRCGAWSLLRGLSSGFSCCFEVAVLAVWS